jgi:predicted dehydrogenase
MYRIGIIGSENSHAMAFSKIFNVESAYPDVRVVAVGGDWPEESEKVKEACGVDFVAEKPSDMLGKVDAVMVTARHGGKHAEFARPFIEAGLPAFIDKPFTVDAADAVALAKRARDKKVPLVGGSSTKDVYDVLTLKNLVRTGGCLGGMVNAPLNMENPYGGFFFYSSHLAEIMLTIFGFGPESVDAHEAGGSVAATAHYENFDVTNHFINGTGYYSAAVFTKTRPVLREIDISMCYRHECEAFARMLRTGEMNHKYEELVYPVFYLNAIYEAYKSGIRRKLPRIGELLD